MKFNVAVFSFKQKRLSKSVPLALWYQSLIFEIVNGAQNGREGNKKEEK